MNPRSTAAAVFFVLALLPRAVRADLTETEAQAWIQGRWSDCVSSTECVGSPGSVYRETVACLRTAPEEERKSRCVDAPGGVYANFEMSSFTAFVRRVPPHVRKACGFRPNEAALSDRQIECSVNNSPARGSALRGLQAAAQALRFADRAQGFFLSLCSAGRSPLPDDCQYGNADHFRTADDIPFDEVSAARGPPDAGTATGSPDPGGTGTVQGPTGAQSNPIAWDLHDDSWIPCAGNRHPCVSRGDVRIEPEFGVARSCVDDWLCRTISDWDAYVNGDTQTGLLIRNQELAVRLLVSDRLTHLRTEMLKRLTIQYGAMMAAESPDCNASVERMGQAWARRLAACEGVDGRAIGRSAILAPARLADNKAICRARGRQSAQAREELRSQARTLAVLQCAKYYVEIFPEQGILTGADDTEAVASAERTFLASPCHPLRDAVHARLQLVTPGRGTYQHPLSAERDSSGSTIKELATRALLSEIACAESSSNPRLRGLNFIYLTAVAQGEENAPSYEESQARQDLERVFQRACAYRDDRTDLSRFMGTQAAALVGSDTLGESEGPFGLDELEDLVGGRVPDPDAEADTSYRDAARFLRYCNRSLRTQSTVEQAIQAASNVCDGFTAASAGVTILASGPLAPEVSVAIGVAEAGCLVNSALLASAEANDASQLAAYRRSLGNTLSCDRAAELMRAEAHLRERVGTRAIETALSAGVGLAQIRTIIREARTALAAEEALDAAAAARRAQGPPNVTPPAPARTRPAPVHPEFDVETGPPIPASNAPRAATAADDFVIPGVAPLPSTSSMATDLPLVANPAMQDAITNPVTLPQALSERISSSAARFEVNGMEVMRNFRPKTPEQLAALATNFTAGSEELRAFQLAYRKLNDPNHMGRFLNRLLGEAGQYMMKAGGELPALAAQGRITRNAFLNAMLERGRRLGWDRVTLVNQGCCNGVEELRREVLSRGGFFFDTPFAGTASHGMDTHALQVLAISDALETEIGAGATRRLMAKFGETGSTRAWDTLFDSTTWTNDGFTHPARLQETLSSTVDFDVIR